MKGSHCLDQSSTSVRVIWEVSKQLSNLTAQEQRRVEMVYIAKFEQSHGCIFLHIDLNARVVLHVQFIYIYTVYVRTKGSSNVLQAFEK